MAVAAAVVMVVAVGAVRVCCCCGSSEAARATGSANACITRSTSCSFINSARGGMWSIQGDARLCMYVMWARGLLLLLWGGRVCCWEGEKIKKREG